MTKIAPCSLILMLLTCAQNVQAQTLPATDLWLANIENGVPAEPVKINISDGYNNQPHFSDDGTIVYYTREMPADGNAAQTDIAAFDTRTAITRMVNQTAESEYSPTPIPGRERVSVIQVEPDQKQRLWAIDVTSGRMELLLPDVEPVGYHAWINKREVAMFILGESFTLQTATLDGHGTQLVADNIGRSLHTHPVSNEILFVDKNLVPWQISAFDSSFKTIRGVMPLFPENEDFTVDSLGNYWTGNDSKLYKRAAGGKSWELMADFKSSGIKHISRLAIDVDSTRIAVVSDHVATTP